MQSLVKSQLRLLLSAWLLSIGSVACDAGSDDVEPPEDGEDGSVVEPAQRADAARDVVDAASAQGADMGTSAVDSGLDAARAGGDASMLRADAASGGAGARVDASVSGDAGATRDAAVAPDAGSSLPAITIWIAGDSTVANGETPCPRGWGGVFASHFDTRVKVQNLAAGGRSVHTWLYNVQTTKDDTTGECVLTRDAQGQPTVQPRWQTMLDGMKVGDYLFVQFGINDASATCDRHVGTAAFETAFGMMAMAAKERGARPIFLTPVSSISCSGDTARGSRGAYVTATQNAGQRLGVPVIDLHALSVALYQERKFCPVSGGDVSAATGGPVGDFFCDDHTHFSSSGATEIAALVARALVDQHLPLAEYLR